MHAVRSSSLRRSCCFIVVSLVAIELSHRLDDFVELARRQLGVNGKRNHFFRRFLALRKRSLGISEILEARLEMERERIVNRIAYSLLLQLFLKFVTSRDPKGVLIVDRYVHAIDDRRSHVGHPCERLVVILSVLSSRSAP